MVCLFYFCPYLKYRACYRCPCPPPSYSARPFSGSAAILSAGLILGQGFFPSSSSSSSFGFDHRTLEPQHSFPCLCNVFGFLILVVLYAPMVLILVVFLVFCFPDETDAARRIQDLIYFVFLCANLGVRKLSGNLYWVENIFLC